MVDPRVVLVTGGAGFIGCNFVRHLLDKYPDVQVVNYDLLTYAGRLENLREVANNPRHKFVRGDIRDRESVELVVKRYGIDTIINFAAETHVDRSIVEAGCFVLTDVYGTYVLLDVARKLDVERVVHISTDEVYGSIERGSFTEEDPLRPSSPYSASKAGADMMVMAFYRTYGLNVVVTRSTNNFGPYQHPEKFIPKLIIRALHDKHLPLYGDGRQVRDWLYVLDNCEATDLVMRKGKPGEIYNVASGQEKQNVEVARAVLRILNKPEPLIEFVEDRPGHDRRYSLSMGKIKQLGWSPKHRFEDALRLTVEWYVKNRWWWEPLLSDRYVISDTPWRCS